MIDITNITNKVVNSNYMTPLYSCFKLGNLVYSGGGNDF